MRQHASGLFMVQAFVKARGDGLGFELGRAEFTLHMHGTAGSARLTVDGRPDSRQVFWEQYLSGCSRLCEAFSKCSIAWW